MIDAKTALSRAARELQNCAAERFEKFGGTDVRGAALWDAAAHIDPEDGAAVSLDD